VCELIVYLYNDTGNDHTGGSDSISNMEIKSYWHLIFFMKDCSIGTILSRKQQSNSSMENSLSNNEYSNSWIWLLLKRENCPNTELIVYLCNDTGYDHTGGYDIFMVLCIINLKCCNPLWVLLFQTKIEKKYGNKILLTFDFF
jgi:hypothetical protein